ncbi:LysR family transcriptional regulator [Stenotrophomonas maltophilia]|uniref:LysR family transcriptional regulator n=1 Tax=Stenotrophomonas maltophilia TaxID=40324 RepID=UPI001F2B2DDC|nr:LysR family transcriptional regulator [Stenotrophomonas maltophilia]MCF3470376.1 LysR family transcriptional regulator [Stenotrophomonas maltophilia]
MADDGLGGITQFVAAVEHGSFAAAAQRLGVTRSAVAKAVSKLEARLGVTLFNRTTRQQALTVEGTQFYEHCQRMMGELRALEASLRQGEQWVQGKVRISAPSLFGRYCVAPLLRELLESHPGLELDVQFSDQVEDLIASGFDLAIRIGPLADTTSLVARLVTHQRMAIFAAPGYLRQHGTPRNAEDLRSHWAVTYGRGASIPPWMIADAGQLVPVQVRSRERYDDLQVVADAAVAGAGLAWMPRWLGMPHVESGALKLVMDSDRVPSIEIHLLWPRTRFLPTRTRAVIEGLAVGLKRFEA